ncbi:hypothetical protein EIP86_003153 [Pleurotus ostreatoroseus]|nr:hypothetical protein EIP86_003153 [Pleurotus ostreatoroseus]
MSAPDFYEASFRWPHAEPNDVIVTGEFDAWSGSKHLNRSSNGFEATFPVPWGRKVAYKYIVDGRWTTTDDQPTEMDSMGNLNNVLNAPARPSTPKAPTLASPQPPSKQTGLVNGAMAAAKIAAVAMVEAIAPGTTDEPLTPVTEQGSESPAVEPTKEVAEPEKAANGTAEEAKEAEPAAEPTSAAEPEPAQEQPVAAEAVLPTAAEEIPAAPVVPVPVLPLASKDAAPVTVGDIQEPLETVIVAGSTTAENVEPATAAAPAAVEPSTHTPAAPAEPETSAVGEAPDAVAAAAVPEAAPAEPSTHTPAPSAETKANGTEAPESVTAPAPAVQPEAEKAMTNGTKPPEAAPAPAAAPAAAPVNGTNGAHESAPAPTPAPATNGKTSSAPSSPGKEKRHAFPTFGRTRRQSSIASVSSGTPDEHGNLAPGTSPSRKSSQREKRRTSFFGRIKDIFSDDRARAQKQ